MGVEAEGLGLLLARGHVLPGTSETEASSMPSPGEARTQGPIKQLTLELGGQHSGARDRTHVPGARC